MLTAQLLLCFKWTDMLDSWWSSPHNLTTVTVLCWPEPACWGPWSSRSGGWMRWYTIVHPKCQARNFTALVVQKKSNMCFSVLSYFNMKSQEWTEDNWEKRAGMVVDPWAQNIFYFIFRNKATITRNEVTVMRDKVKVTRNKVRVVRNKVTVTRN